MDVGRKVIIEAGDALVDEAVERGGNVWKLFIFRRLKPKKNPDNVVVSTCEKPKFDLVFVRRLP